AAPVGLPPEAMVCRPQRLLLSTIWKTMAMTMAQIMPANAAPPKKADTQAPASGCTGKPPEIFSVTPLIKNSAPSAVTNAGTRKYTVMAPLHQPTTPATSTATMTAGTAGKPACRAKYMMNGANAYTEPTDKSSSRVMSTIAAPTAIIAVAA